MTLPEFTLLRPRALPEALEMLDRHRGEVQILAGGTDLVPSMKQRLFSPRYILDLKAIRDLGHIRNGHGLEIGALATVESLADSVQVQHAFPVLSQAAATIASPVLRTMGTIGGNLCLDTRCLWYNQSQFWRQSCGFCLKKDGSVCHVAPGGDRCWAVFSGDLAPALLTLGAEIEIAGAAGVRRIPISDFHTGDGMARMNLAPGEILTRVLVPASSAGMRGAYLKYRLRDSIDYPLAGVAVALDVAEDGTCRRGSIAVTALNPKPLLIAGASEALAGARLSDDLLERLADLTGRAIKPLSTSVSTPDYRRHIARVFVKRAVTQAFRPVLFGARKEQA
jgi:4-hydroxybenzoyl-CoA reductase subunit beta